MEFYKILENLMKELNMNIPDVCRSTGISDSTLRSIINRKTKSASLEVAFKISKGLNVSLEKLNGDSVAELKKPNFYLDNNAKKIIEKYTALTPSCKTVVEKHIDNLLAYESELKKIQTKKAELFELKPQSKELTVYDLPASAGTGQFLDSDAYQIIEFPVNEIPKNTTFGVRVSGNSMEPQFFDKDIAFVQRVHEVSSGSIGVFILNGDAYIKKMVCDQDECYLVSLNTSYDPIKIRIEDDLRIVGKVLWISWRVWKHFYKVV